MLGRILILMMIVLAGSCFAADGPMPLSFKQSIDLALKNNIEVLLAKAKSMEAQGQKISWNADLLPQIDAVASQQRTWWENIGALGFPGFTGAIGPFNTFNASLMVSGRILDFSALAHAQAGRIKWRSSELQVELAAQQVILATGSAYIQALGYQAQLSASNEDIKLAEHFLALSLHQKDAGLASELDVSRNRTVLAQQRARQVELSLNVIKSQLQLKRLIKIPLVQPIELTDMLNYWTYDHLTPENAIAKADKERMEILIAHADSDYSLAQLKAVRREYLPKVNLTGQWGETGINPQKEVTHAASAMIGISMPLWDSGKIAGEVKEQAGENQEQVIRAEDLNWKIEEDVRVALETLVSARAQVNALKQVGDYAERELTLAQDRFAAGLGDNIQVINAQDTLVDAKDKYVQSLAQYDQAQLNYCAAVGDPRSFDLSTKGNN